MHEEFVFDVDSSDTVFLCIHGILGTPNHFDFLIEKLPKTVGVHNILLDGHGKNVEYFANTSMIKWQEQVDEKVEYLTEHYDNIIIIGHSMGTLFGMELSFRYTDKIKFLFLLQSPMRMGVKPCMIKHSLQVIYDKIDYNDKVCVATKNAFSITADRQLFKYVSWTPRYIELFIKAFEVAKMIEKLPVPCVIFQSQYDELVPISSCKVIQKNTDIKLTVLPKSGHFYYEDMDVKLILDEFEKIKEKYGIY